MEGKKLKKRKIESRYQINTDELMQSIGNAGIYTFLYYPKEKTITVPQNTCEEYGLDPIYENMPYSYADEKVEDNEKELCYQFYRRIDQGEPSSTVELTRTDTSVHVKSTLTTIKWDSAGNPEVAIGIIENRTELFQEKQLVKEITQKLNTELEFQQVINDTNIVNIIAYGIGEIYYAIYHIWVEDHSYVCYREKLKGILGEIGTRGDYIPAWEAYIHNYVYPEDQEKLAEFADFYTLADRLNNKNTISHIYRRIDIGWTRGQFIAAKRDTNGKVTNIIFTVTDINEEMELKLKKEKAEQEALHDSMTGLLNRKAFEENTSFFQNLSGSIGLLIIDIDRFKNINDQFGHAIGDQVIIKVASLIKNFLSKDELAYRIGGDEFVVLLPKYTENTWKRLCKKISAVHDTLKENFDVKLSITLSVGICISSNKYCKEMYQMADTALYHTKTNGRGGCTMVDCHGKVLKEWHDNKFHFRGNLILSENNTATWKAEIPKNPAKPIRLFCDDVMKKMIEADDGLSPEEMYTFWEDRIVTGYKESIDESMKSVYEKKAVEVTYLWNHPSEGTILLRCGAAYDCEKDDCHCIYGYYHNMKHTKIFTKKDISADIKNALEEIYSCNLYINMDTLTFESYKLQPHIASIIGNSGNAQDAADLFLNHVVSPESRGEMAFFLNLHTLSDRMKNQNVIECNYIENNNSWCKARFIAVKRDKNDKLKAVSFVIESINEIKTKELQQQMELKEKAEIISSLAEQYHVVLYIDFENNYYHAISKDQEFLSYTDYFGEVYPKLQSVYNQFVSDDNSDNVKEYKNLTKIRELLKDTDHLAVEYKEKNVDWCVAEYQIARRDDHGIPMAVLVTSRIIGLNNKNKEEISISVNNNVVSTDGRSLDALFNNVPGGIIMYEWNGKQLKTLYISDYYAKQYGDSMVSDGMNKGGPNFMRIHPDDLIPYQEAITKELMQTHHLDYVYRVWNEDAKRYFWNKINAISMPQTDGTSLVYAMYSDVTEQKDAELRLEKNHVSMEAALKVSNQLCYEYDPVAHTGICYTDTNFFHLPKRIVDYPDSLRDYDLFHPEDTELFISTAHKMDTGISKAQCDVRIKKDNEYRWYNCAFTSYFDLEKDRNVAILTVVDISFRVSTINAYEERLKTMLYSNNDSLYIGSFNLTNNTFSCFNVQEEMQDFINSSSEYETLISKTANRVIGKKEQEKYRKLFSRNNLLKLESKGHTHVQMDHLYRISENHAEWLETVIDLVENPITREIEGICYAKNTNEICMARLLMEKIMQQDYPMAAIVFADSTEYYIYDSEKGIYGNSKHNFWDNIIITLSDFAVDSSQLQKVIKKETILEKLKTQNEFVYAFDAHRKKANYRLELKFSNLDKDHNLILASLRNITDRLLLHKLQYDNEHDPLTNLYNRGKVFKKCKKLLLEHPDEQFAMLHFDIKHFHLYNTFFGDDAGDRLLCDIAKILRELDDNYEYWAFGRIEADVFCLFFPFKKDIYEKHLKKSLEKIQNYREDFLIEPAIGIYFVTDKTMSIESMFTRATIASKKTRNNVNTSVVFYDDSMEQKMAEEQQIINEMQTALDRRQFQVYLQPKYSLRTEEPVGAEALVRWIHPQKGVISPGQFIPVFERNGFIANLDRYVWEQVCQLLRKWQNSGKLITPISVNVSRISMYSSTTVQFLKNLVSKYEIDPKYLELELTETAYMDDPVEMKEQLHELQLFGFKILMDDFGSGYSSLNTLRELPVDCLKLDMKFLTHSAEDARGRLVLSSIIRMSKLLNLAVIAEGVEKPEQADFLRSLGCEYVQGYLFARPMPVTEYEQTIISPDLPLAIESKSHIDWINKYLSDTDSNSNLFVENMPIPSAVVEITNNNEFVHLRTNKSFLSEFGMLVDTKPASKIFREHLNGKSLEILLNAYQDCAQTHEMKDFKFNWNSDNGIIKNYCGRVSFVGEMGNLTILVVLFMDITNL